MASKNFPIHFLWWVILVATDKLYTAATVHSYDQSDLYMHVTTKAFVVATTRAQVT